MPPFNPISSRFERPPVYSSRLMDTFTFAYRKGYLQLRYVDSAADLRRGMLNNNIIML